MKKTVFIVGVALFNWLLIELGAWLIYQVKYGSFDAHELQLQRVRIVQDNETGPGYSGNVTQEQRGNVVVREAIHPYVGYVVDGKRKVEDCQQDEPLKCLRRIRGYADTGFPKRGEDKLIVGVTGGSVAVSTVNNAYTKTFEGLLATLAEYQGREIIVVNMAMGGYRQPQQAMLVNYYYALGAEFDIILNLDGFNDVAIPASEYKWRKQHPILPRSWASRVEVTPTPEFLEELAHKTNLTQSQSRAARLAAKPVLRLSPLSNLIWQLRNSYLESNLAQVNAQLESLSERKALPRDLRFDALGPDFKFTSWEDMHRYNVESWATSSKLIDAVAKAHDALYIHFLQPNQYIEGSKPSMIEAERQIAYSNSPGYGHIYREAYPFIQAKKPWFEQQGIHFVDLTFLYKDVEQPIYADNCCHTNSIGSEMMVQAMVDAIEQYN